MPLLVRMLRDTHQKGDIDPDSLGLSVNNPASTLIAAAHGLALKDAAFVAARFFSHRLRVMVRAILRDIQDSWYDRDGSPELCPVRRLRP